MALKVSSAGVCCIGRVRKDNQDSILCDAGRLVFAVSDGIGGGNGGAMASGMVRECLESAEISGEMSDRRRSIAAAMEKANGEVFSRARSQGLKMAGATVALIAFAGGDSRMAVVCHAGDSRVYRIRSGRAELLTYDHTVGAALAKRFSGSKEAAGLAMRSNRLAHVLTRAVGTDSSLECEWRDVEIAGGDVYLVCTDGVHDVIRDEEIAGLAAGCGPDEAVKRVSAEVERRGSPDNYSIVVAKVEECR